MQSTASNRSKPSLSKLLAPLASLKLTVVLLVLGMLLIFAGTTVQSELSIWDVQHRYFHSWFTIIEWRLFFPLWEWGSKHMPGAMPFPGGYTLIVLLLANLLAAHATRFRASWKRSGILLLHAGLILLLVGEIVTTESASEGQMTIDVGSSANFVQDIRQVELAVTDPSPADRDDVVVIPAARLVRAGTVQHPKLPFAIQIDAYYLNSDFLGPMQAGAEKNARATAGAGVGITVVPRPKFSSTDGQSVDVPSAYLTLSANGQSLGTYLVSLFFDQPQVVKVDGKDYWIQLRFKREYKPYTVHLLTFSHDRYTGTDIPKNFASRVRLVDPTRNVDREVLIWMNHPLRYAGETFYQASFKPGDKTSVLQVVHNPGWLIPYISCSMVGLGLVVHFGMQLLGFLRRRNSLAPVLRGEGRGAGRRAPNRVSWIPAAIATGLCAIYLLGTIRPTDSREQSAGFNLDLFSRVPVSFEGRTMPLDSLARNSLRILSGKSELQTDGGKRPAIEWLADLFAQPERAAKYKVLRIDHPDILSLLGLDESRKLFAVEELWPKLDKLNEQFTQARQTDPKKRDLVQRKIIELVDRVQLFNQLAGIEPLFLSPPLVAKDWRSYGEAMQAVEKSKGQERDPGAEAFLAMIQADHQGQPDQFNAIAGEYRNLLEHKLPEMVRKLDIEVLFNRAEPFISSMVLYVIVFILAAMSWLKWHGPLSRAALWVLVLALIYHTLGLTTRIYLQGRPPVTNLYSSAIFIAWAAVAFCVAMELIYRNGVASAAASAIAFPSLLIAHYLAGDGDTMRMLQAVLDTNIWLATHVVVITLGYAATFLAGFLAIGYVLSGVLTTALNGDVRKSFYRMIYGVVCFALLFSFVGTILGGIWADQSWGRFWGWDPKENGAVLIVLWNAVILHARWGGVVRERGFALLAIGGNIVTAWSWFGTNMLGVGLHSYGFMDSAVTWLAIFVGVQLFVIALGSLPQHLWRSFQIRGPSQERHEGGSYLTTS